MSAFICGPDHFIALSVFAAHRCRGQSWRVDPRYVKDFAQPSDSLRGIENLTAAELATRYADVLYKENIRSVRARYPSDTWETLPGPCIKPLHIVVTYQHFNHKHWVLSPVAILKMCDCLEYQSCETDDYENSVAYRLLNAIRRAAIRALPDYEDAPWDYYIPEQQAA